MPIIGYKPNFNELFREHYDPNAEPEYDDDDVDVDDDRNDYSQGANQAYYDKLMKQHKEREERRNAHTLSKVISSPSRRKSTSTILSTTTHTDPLILGDFVISRSNRRGSKSRSRSKSRSKSRSRSNDDKTPPISGGKSRRVFRRKMTSRRRQRRSTRSKHKH